jgi:hypothetical protein
MVRWTADAIRRSILVMRPARMAGDRPSVWPDPLDSWERPAGFIVASLSCHSRSVADAPARRIECAGLHDTSDRGGS